MIKKSVFFIILILLFFSAFIVSAQNNPTQSVAKVISSAPPTAGTWTSAIATARRNLTGFLNISIVGSSWVGTVTLQRSCYDVNGTATWCDVTTWTADAEKAIIDRQRGISYRLGVKNGERTSGSVALRLTVGREG